MFVDDIVRDGAHACDYLLTVDMEMTVSGYRTSRAAHASRRRPICPIWAPCAARAGSTGPRSCSCRREGEKTHDLVDVAPRSILRKQKVY